MVDTFQVFIRLAVPLFGTLLGYLFDKLYNERMRYIRMASAGLPVAPNHSFLFGHLLFIKRIASQLPSNASGPIILQEVAFACPPDPGMVYLDLWPMTEPICLIISSQVNAQISQNNAHIRLLKPPNIPRFFAPITGGPALFDMPEKDWKPVRARFNHAFSPDLMLSHVEKIVQQTLIYVETLRTRAADGKMFQLDPLTLRFTIGLIGKTSLGFDWDCQRGYSEIPDRMLQQIRWLQPNQESNPLEYFNYARTFFHWWNGRQMDHAIGKEVDLLYSQVVEEVSARNIKGSSRKNDSIIAQYLKDYATETRRHELEPGFKKSIIQQIRLFIFAGHDSLSATICYALHMLSKHPDYLEKLRKEHDKILGTDPSAAPDLLRKQPLLTHSLIYTNAIVKETLRLFPPGSCARLGYPDATIVDDTGKACPTDEFFLWGLHIASHRDPRNFPDPDAFNPERFLVGPDSPLYPPANAWRPFENGPRNCVAQPLALIELKTILALLVREFDVIPAYDEWDTLHPRKGLKMYRGERAYQVDGGAAHPADGYPCRVKLSKYHASQ